MMGLPRPVLVALLLVGVCLAAMAAWLAWPGASGGVPNLSVEVRHGCALAVSSLGVFTTCNPVTNIV